MSSFEGPVEGAERGWNRSAAEVLRALDVEGDNGLELSTVGKRLERDGPNRLDGARPRPGWVRLLTQFRDVTVLALLVAAALAATLGLVESADISWVARFGDSVAILLIVLLNALMGFVQESRAQRAMESLRDMLSPTATVVREGSHQTTPAEGLVTGDLVALEEGDRVPADGRLISTADLALSEAALTGESTPVTKNAECVLPRETPLAERSNMVFMAGHVVRGSALMVVTATGMRTEMGRIAQLLGDVPEESTPLERQMNRFGSRVVLGCVVLAVVLFAVGWVRLDVTMGFLVLTVVSLAVAAIPEGLPAITTVVLAFGVRTMASSKALVRRMAAVEALGGAHVICSDKTGTLTQNHMAVRELWAGGSRVALSELQAAGDSARWAQLVFATQFAPAARAIGERGEVRFNGDPTDVALLEFHARYGAESHGGVVRKTFPFSAERKLASVLLENSESHLELYVHGAPETVLERCSSWSVDGEQRPLDRESQSQLDAAIHAWAHEGLRVLALGRRRVSASASDVDLENTLTLLGLVALSDPPRPEVREAILRARNAGVRTMMITGDHPVTGGAIARELGITDQADEVMTSAELEELGDAELDRRVDSLAVIARATADDKLRVVRALERRGYSVAMTGDGVNDAPAIKAAAIGIAMGRSGTDVSREVADLVLLDDNYATIVAAIEQGRAIYANIQRFVAFLFAANAGLVLLVVAGMLLGWPALLTPTQILWINLITNGFPALALGMEPVLDDPMSQPPRPREAPLLDRRHWLTIACIGGWLAVVGLVVFDWAEQAHGLDHARTMTFCVLALGPICHTFGARSERSLLRVPFFANRLLLISVGASLGLQAVAVYTPGLAEVFGTTPIPAGDAALALLCAASVLPFGELLKRVTRRRLPLANAVR
jgi:Ca2+-transporting ATPase